MAKTMTASEAATKTREAVEKARKTGAATETRLRGVLTNIAAVQAEMATICGDKTLDAKTFKQRVTACNGKLARLAKPYAAK